MDFNHFYLYNKPSDSLYFAEIRGLYALCMFFCFKVFFKQTFLVFVKQTFLTDIRLKDKRRLSFLGFLRKALVIWSSEISFLAEYCGILYIYGHISLYFFLEKRFTRKGIWIQWFQVNIYRILHELSFHINFYQKVQKYAY